MDLNDAFSSFGRFWESISALVLASAVFLLALRYVVGIRFPVRRWIKTAGETESGRELKGWLEGVGLWTKLPIVGVGALLFFFVLFNWSVSLVRGATRFEPLETQFSLIDSWRDHKAWYQVEQLAQYAPLQTNNPVLLSDVSNAYYTFLDDYRRASPQRYAEWTDGAKRQLQTPTFLYGAAELGLLVLVVGGIYFLIRLIRRRSRIRLRHVTGWLALVVLISVVAGPIFRYRMEVKLEQAQWQDVSFVLWELERDQARKKLREGESMDPLRERLGKEMCLRQDWERDWETFSLARTVDGVPVLDRLFRAVAYGTYPRPRRPDRDEQFCESVEPNEEERERSVEG